MNKILKRVLTVVLSVFLIAYVGYQLYQMVYSPVTTETVYSYSTYQTIDTNGITVRDETVITTKTDGYVYYLAEDGTRVSKKGTIAQVFASEEDALAQTMIERLEAEIDTLEKIEEQKNATNVNLSVVNKQVKNTVRDTVKQLNNERFENIYEIRAALTDVLNKQAVMVGSTAGFADRIKELKAELKAYKAGHAQATTAVKSPVSGYFVGQVDGFENLLTVDMLEDISPDGIRSILKSKPAASSGIGKVVGDYEWYMVCVVPAGEMLALSQGDAIDIRLPFVSDKIIPMTVRRIAKDAAGDTALVMSCSYMSNELSSIRKETVQVLVKKYEGLRVPKKALVFDEQNVPGVYVRVGNTIVFRKVELLYSTADYCICAEKDLKEYLKLYDDVVIDGKGLYDGKMVN